MKKEVLIFALLLSVMAAGFASASSLVSVSFDLSQENDSSITYGEIIDSSSVLLEVQTNVEAVCRYSQTSGESFDSMPGTFDISAGRVHRKTLDNLGEGTHEYFVRCRELVENASDSAQLGIRFTISLPVSAVVRLSRDPPLKEGIYEVELETSKLVAQTPSLSYSLDGVSYTPIPLSGSGRLWKGYLIIPKDAGEKVGSFQFQGVDLAGQAGTQISEGAVFIVDTLPPDVVESVKAEGQENAIKLTWNFEESADKFRIYRSTSPNVGKADFYVETEEQSYTDSNVESGKTYYYKISAVDEAGNEGRLSPEVYATALLANVSVEPTGLDPSLVGFVDSFLTEIDSVSLDIERAKLSFSSEKGKKKEIFERLKLSREIDSIESELNALRRDVEGFKKQTLTRTQLDKKISSSRLRLDAIKSRMPESLIIDDESSVSGAYDEQELRRVVFDVYAGKDERELEKIVSEAMKTKEKSSFGYTTKAYNLQIVYLDGSRKELSLVEKSINGVASNSSFALWEYIPKEFAASVNEVSFKNTNYQVVKEDPIVGFDSDVKEIAYTFDKHIDIKSVGKIKTFLVELYSESEGSQTTENKLTGYATLANFIPSKDTLGIFVVISLVLFLGAYFVYLRWKNSVEERLIPVRRRILKAWEKLESNDVQGALNIYRILKREYKELGKREKSAVYEDMTKLYRELSELTQGAKL